MTGGSVRVIAVVNMKGGVGKTSTVVSLADALGTATETAVLVVDVDTQASASYCLVGDRIREIIGEGRTIDTFLRLSLLEMTPYWWSTVPTRRDIIATTPLTVDVDVRLTLYVKPANGL